MPDDKSDQDVTENDDDEDMDLKIDGNTDEDVRGYDEISVITQLVFVVDEDTDDEVCGYKEIKVNENDDNSNVEVNEDTLDDEVKNFSVDVEENFKVELEDPNEFIEVKVERNVV